MSEDKWLFLSVYREILDSKLITIIKLNDFTSGTSIVIIKGMKLLLISIDPILVNVVTDIARKSNFEIMSMKENVDPLEILSTVCSMGPHAIIFDDDYLESRTMAILKSIKKVNKKVAIIFVTSNDSIELGREISNLGVQFYGLKPLSDDELNDLLASIPNLVNKHLN